MLQIIVVKPVYMKESIILLKNVSKIVREIQTAVYWFIAGIIQLYINSIL